VNLLQEAVGLIGAGADVRRGVPESSFDRKPLQIGIHTDDILMRYRIRVRSDPRQYEGDCGEAFVNENRSQKNRYTQTTRLPLCCRSGWRYYSIPLRRPRFY